MDSIRNVPGMMPQAPQAARKKDKEQEPEKMPSANKDPGTPKEQAERAKTAEKDWTVLYYLDGNNWMSSQAISTLKQLEYAGSDKKVNFVAQVSRPKSWIDRFTKDWSGGKRYYVINNDQVMTPGKMLKDLLFSKFPPYTKGIGSLEVGDLGKVDMGKGETLEDFLKWGMKTFPAKHYMVVMMGPSAGIHGMMADTTTGSEMKPEDLKKAFDNAAKETGKKVDVLNIDGSSVANMEMAYQLKDSVGYLVGAQGIMAGTGAPIVQIASEIKSAEEYGELDPLTVTRYNALIGSMMPTFGAFGHTVSAIDMSKITPAVEAWKDLTKALMGAKVPVDVLRDMVKETQEFNHTAKRPDAYKNRDAYHFAELISKSDKITDPAVKEAAKKAMTAIEAALVGDAHTGPLDKNAHGLSIFMPENYGYFRPDTAKPDEKFDHKLNYGELGFSKDTNWDEFLTSIAKDTPFNRALKKLGVSEKFIDKMTGFKRDKEGTVHSLSGWASFIGWLAGFNAISQKPSGFLFLNPVQASAVGVYGGLYDAYNAGKEAVNSATRLKSFDRTVLSGMDVARGLAKSAANLGFLAPALVPFAPAAAMGMFLMPWIKDFYGIYAQYKAIRDGVELSNLPMKDKLAYAALSHYGSKVQWDH
jgi:hypothetical protein